MRKNAWTTEDEIDFVRNLGKHVPNAPDDHRRLRRQYEKSMALRANWGGIDPKEVLRAL